jgi:hypothetical protein
MPEVMPQGLCPPVEDIQQAYDSMNRLLGLVDIIYPNHSAIPVYLKG